MVLVRIAPSPTGLLHVGNVRTGLINYLFTKKAGGQFMLRLDDTDTERSTKEYEDKIKRDFEWLGMSWDTFDRQSDRGERYLWGFEALKESGRLYPCYETPEELDIKRKIQMSRGLPPLYDRAALKLTDAEKTKFEDEGRTPHWRFKMNHAEIKWQDMGRGDVSFEGAKLGDPVLFREDMKPIYMLASTVDDMDHGVTHVIRGEDHITNTAIMIQICEALGGTAPTFGHLSLLTTADGEGMSKRKGTFSIESMRDDDGIEPMAICAHLAKLGTSDPVEPKLTMQELIDEFDMAKFSRATPKYDYEDTKALNAKLIHMMPYESVKDRLSENEAKMDAAMWDILKANVNSLSEVESWLDVLNGPVTPVIEAEDQDYIAEAAATLPPAPWSEETWGTWTAQLKESTGRKGKSLFMPLRQALTGMSHGPEMPKLLPLLDESKARTRLKGDAA